MTANVYSSLRTLYRTLDEGPTTDFSVHRVNGRPRRRDGSSQVVEPPTAPSCRSLRKAQPASGPLPGTMKWIARLPRDVRPLQLLREFPRVANALAASWHDREALRMYLHELVVDRRGNRRGFPDRVLSELLALRSHFENSRF